MIKKRGKGWHGESERHRQVAKKAKTSKEKLLEKVETLEYLKKLKHIDSKTISEWIQCCMRKHGPKGDGTMTHKQCVAAAYKKFGKSKKDLIDFLTLDAKDKRPPKEWWSACYKTIKKSNPEYTDEQIRKTCGMIYHRRGVRKKMGDFISTPIITPLISKFISLEPKSLQTDAIPFSEFKQIKTDFETQDFVIFHGALARDGPYKYLDEKTGEMITLYKEINNLKDIYSRYDYLPVKATEKIGAHYAEELGYGTNFSYNENTNEIEFDLVLVNDDNFKEIIKNKNEYHVSPGYNDIVKNNIQYITDVDHIALSLGKETGRACTGFNSKGASCSKVRPIKINHDQSQIQIKNLEVVNN